MHVWKGKTGSSSQIKCFLAIVLPPRVSPSFSRLAFTSLRLLVTRVVTDVLLLSEKVERWLSREINRLSGAPVVDSGRARGRQWAGPRGPRWHRRWCWWCARRGSTSPAPTTWPTPGLPWRRRRGRWVSAFAEFTVNCINYSPSKPQLQRLNPALAESPN